MRRRTSLFALVGAFMTAALPAAAKTHRHHHRDEDAAAPGLADATLLVVRHAEKPADESDRGLSPAGVARAKGYATYFRSFAIDGARLPVTTLIASADSDASARPRLTLEPLARASGLRVQTPFKNKQVDKAASWIAHGAIDDPARGATLIAWHHGKLPDLLQALGADPADVLPGGIWPDEVYDWVIVLRYDHEGRFASARRVIEPAKVE